MPIRRRIAINAVGAALVGLGWAGTQLAVQPIVGDVDGNGVVDFQDMLIVSQNYGKTGPQGLYFLPITKVEVIGATYRPVVRFHVRAQDGSESIVATGGIPDPTGFLEAHGLSEALSEGSVWWAP